jgi:hypothetical protein
MRWTTALTLLQNAVLCVVLMVPTYSLVLPIR